MIKKLNSRGDTIVEVLISILVVSAVLAGAYVSATRSLNNSRQSQERAEALKLLEAQVEQVKQLANTDDDDIFSTGELFCINNGAIADATASSLATMPGLGTAVAFTAECSGKGQGALYSLAVQRQGNLFSFYARWDRAGGGGDDQVRILNRVYAP